MSCLLLSEHYIYYSHRAGQQWRDQWMRSGGGEVEKKKDAQTKWWKNKFVAELGRERDFSLRPVYVNKWKLEKRRLKMQPLQKSKHKSAVHSCFLHSVKNNSSLNPNLVLFSVIRMHRSTVIKGTVWRATTEWNKCVVTVYFAYRPASRENAKDILKTFVVKKRQNSD